jgi:hypothetical protein
VLAVVVAFVLAAAVAAAVALAVAVAAAVVLAVERFAVFVGFERCVFLEKDYHIPYYYDTSRTSYASALDLIYCVLFHYLKKTVTRHCFDLKD